MRKLLFLVFITGTAISGMSQTAVPAYAITAPAKGASKWCEVKMMDMTSGVVSHEVYTTSRKTEIYSASTGKLIKIKEPAINALETPALLVHIVKKYEAGKQAVDTVVTQPAIDMADPFGSRSAACGFDPQTGRLYYTPLSVAQLRYIDTKDPSRVYFFDDAPFGIAKADGNTGNQITRMVFANGYGYAITNNADHIYRFKADKKLEVTDLGALRNAMTNDTNSVHHSRNYGGDLVADAGNSLYLICGNHAVYRISLQNNEALFLGFIKGLPATFTTNGAIVGEKDRIIVSSSVSTDGYFSFDLEDMQAEKLTGPEPVFNSSDLANGKLLFEKKPETGKTTKDDTNTGIRVYPNPVTRGFINIYFDNLPYGKYVLELTDLSGKTIARQPAVVQHKTQTDIMQVPSSLSKGSYMINVLNSNNEITSTSKIMIL